jgi:sugar/nucleoside kinase (ribokinase family)
MRYKTAGREHWMAGEKYDILLIGHVSKDIEVTGRKEERSVGGAALYSSFAIRSQGAKACVLTKLAYEDENLLDCFEMPREDIICLPSRQTTSIRNEFFSADKERRSCTAVGIADPYTVSDIPPVKAKIYDLCGLIAGDYDNDVIDVISKQGKVAADLQGFLRRAVDGRMLYADWTEKRAYIPKISFLKADAAEAEVITGISDRYDAARQLSDWGAGEVMVTYNTEVIVYDGHDFYKEPLKPRNLSGRTGRGDTCFGSYIAKRLTATPEESLLYAAAAVSLKMETPGPFKGTAEDVKQYIDAFYR